jgi:hypothetical protein
MKRGVLYYHFNMNQRYLSFLKQSVESLKKHMPTLPVTVFGPFTKADLGEDCLIDEVITTKAPEKRGAWPQKIACLIDQPYDQALFMDSDTFFVDSVMELFMCLEKYDLVATLEHHYFTRMRSAAPMCFPELNYGMFLWRKNEDTRRFFERAFEICKRRAGGCDQPSFRVALWETGIKYCVVPWEYNCRYYFPGYLFERAKILHSVTDDFERDEKMLNEKAYEDYPPFKRVFTGTKFFLLKKRWARTQAPLDTVKEVEYR